MNISPINNNITTNYYNLTKTNNAPAFKGEFKPIMQMSDSTEKEIKEFFKKYTSPGFNINNSIGFSVRDRYSYFTPFMPKICGDNFCPGIVLEHVPINCIGDIKYYITNVKDIEDEILNMTFNYYKNYVDKYDFRSTGNGWCDVVEFKKFEYVPEYLKKQYEYLEKHPDRLPTSYKAKLDLFKNYTESAEFQKVFNALKELAK